MERYSKLIHELKDNLGLIEAQRQAKNQIQNEYLDELLDTKNQLTIDEKISKIITILNLMRK
jgi:hypothetical protein